MGTVYRVTCPICDYEEQFCLGSGLGGNNLLGCIGALSKAEQIKVRKMYESKRIAHFTVENKLAECRRCRTPDKLKNKTIVTITTYSGQRFIFGSCCNDCGQKLHIYDIEQHKVTDQVACPSCKELFLIINKEGYWD